jgi:hypothetical protein
MRTRFSVRFLAEWGRGYAGRGFTLEIGTLLSNICIISLLEGEAREGSGITGFKEKIIYLRL